MDSRDAKTKLTYLPDTPEARVGLDNIAAAIERVSLQLQDFLLPEQIQRTLQRSGADISTLLLESPKDLEEANKIAVRGCVP